MRESELRRAYGLTRRKGPSVRICRTCGREFIGYPRFGNAAYYCSRACWYVEHGKRPQSLRVVCKQCGQVFRRTAAAVARVERVFCSQRCSWTYHTGEQSPVWRGGERHWRGEGWTKARALVRERDRVCRRCGKTPEENGEALSVDHVVPFRVFEDPAVANDPENLVALCRICHARKQRAERRYLLGDVIEFERFRDAVREPWPSTVPSTEDPDLSTVASSTPGARPSTVSTSL